MAKKFYVVAKGRKTGIFTQWFGADGAEAQIKNFQGAVYKGFMTREEAVAWLQEKVSQRGSAAKKSRTATPKKNKSEAEALTNFKADVSLYTDGGCLNNPGPGGYGVIIVKGDQRKEISGGFRLTTNNRMELTACIVGLQALEKPQSVLLQSDSKYVVDGISKGWAKKWKRNQWVKYDGRPALNPDLWDQLLALCDYHKVVFKWIKGHAGHPENERCDQMAKEAASKGNLPVDQGYVSGSR